MSSLTVRGYPDSVTWVTCKWKEEAGEGHREGRRKEGGSGFIMVRVRWRSRGSLVSQGRWGHGGAQQQSIRFQMHMNDQLLAPLKLWGEIARAPFEPQF